MQFYLVEKIFVRVEIIENSEKFQLTYFQIQYRIQVFLFHKYVKICYILISFCSITVITEHANFFPSKTLRVVPTLITPVLISINYES